MEGGRVDEHTGATPAPDSDLPLPGGGPEQPDTRWWMTIDRRHRTVLTVAAIVGVVLLAVGVGVGVAVLGSASTAPLGPKNRVLTPAQKTTAATETTAPMPTETTATTATLTATSPAAPASAANGFVAYRQDAAIWVARQDGSDPHMVFSSALGPYALSPNGSTLAVVDTASGTFSLVDISSLRATVIGTAVPEQPAWAPDSSHVVFTTQPSGTHDTLIEQVSRDGTGRRALGPGSEGRVAPDGSVIGISTDRGAGDTPMVVYTGPASRLLGSGVTVDAVAPIPARVVFADAGDVVLPAHRRLPSLQSIALDGSDQKVLVARPKTAAGAFFDDVVASPDGAWIAYTEAGDDGYSRLFAIRSSGGKATALSIRHDDYIVGWSADGTEILFIEGNAIQQETTRLMAVRPNGSGRRIVVDGAGF
jgi:hypothetical protein